MVAVLVSPNFNYIVFSIDSFGEYDARFNFTNLYIELANFVRSENAG